jgi:PAS domain S-box-containing protein
MKKILEVIKNHRNIILFFSAFTFIVIILAIFIFRKLENNEKDEAHDNLATLARLKINDVIHWRKERISDTRFIYHNITYKKLIYKFINNPDNNSIKKDVIDWLQPIKENHEYTDILIIDNSQKTYSLFKNNDSLDERDKQYYLESVRTKKVILGGLYKNQRTDKVSMCSFAPLFLSGINKDRVFAVLILKINPAENLFPLIQLKSLISKTAETFIVRREGNSVLYLNELMNKKNSAFNFSLPLSMPELPSAKAVLGYKGFFEGIDYNGNRVLADLNSIPNSDWFIVSKINNDEIYEPIREQAFLIILAAVFLILLGGFGVRNTLKNQKIKFYQKQLKLEHEKTELSKAVDQSPASIIITDLNGCIEYVNPKFIEVSGYSFREVKGRNPRILKSGLTPEYTYKELWKTLNEGNTWHGEFINKKKNGDIYWEIVSISPIKSEAGMITNYVAVQEDITQKKNIEEALRQSEEQYRFLFASMMEGFAYCKMIFKNDRPVDFIYINVNDAFTELTGLKDVVGKKVSKVIPGIRDSNPELLELYGKVALTGEPERFETYLDMLKIWLSISVYSPEKGYFITMFDNITERKKAEKAIEHAVKELERSNEELEQFAYIASHDLQEPIRMVMLYTQMLKDKYINISDDNAKLYMNFLEDGSVRMYNLINDLLEYSRIAFHDKTYKRTDCTEVIKEVIDDLKYTIEQEKAIITYNNLPSIVCNKTQIRQLFQNIISNAIKFRNENTPLIDIKCESNNGNWLFSVKDNGIGIDNKHFEKIFVIFQRLHTRDKYPGTGIGLAICKKIVERHGGHIFVESEKGKGSVFYFTIPQNLN